MNLHSSSEHLLSCNVTHQGSQGGLIQRRVTLHRHVDVSCQAQVRRDGVDVESCCYLVSTDNVWSATCTRLVAVLCVFVFFHAVCLFKAVQTRKLPLKINENKPVSRLRRAYFDSSFVGSWVAVKAENRPALSHEWPLAAFWTEDSHRKV